MICHPLSTIYNLFSTSFTLFEMTFFVEVDIFPVYSTLNLNVEIRKLSGLQSIEVFVYVRRQCAENV